MEYLVIFSGRTPGNPAPQRPHIRVEVDAMYFARGLVCDD